MWELQGIGAVAGDSCDREKSAMEATFAQIMALRNVPGQQAVVRSLESAFEAQERAVGACLARSQAAAPRPPTMTARPGAPPGRHTQAQAQLERAVATAVAAKAGPGSAVVPPVAGDGAYWRPVGQSAAGGGWTAVSLREMTDPFIGFDQPTGRTATVFVAPGTRPPGMDAELAPGTSFGPAGAMPPAGSAAAAAAAEAQAMAAPSVDAAVPAAYVPMLAQASAERAKDAALERERMRLESAERMAAILGPRRAEVAPKTNVWPWVAGVGGAVALSAAWYFWRRG